MRHYQVTSTVTVEYIRTTTVPAESWGEAESAGAAAAAAEFCDARAVSTDVTAISRGEVVATPADTIFPPQVVIAEEDEYVPVRRQLVVTPPAS